MSDLICAIMIIISVVVFFIAVVARIGEDRKKRSLIDLVAIIIIIAIYISGCVTLAHIKTTYKNVDENIEIASVKKLENNDGTSYVITTKDDNEYGISHEYTTCNGYNAPSVKVIESETDEYEVTTSITYKIESFYRYSKKEKDTDIVIIKVPSEVYYIYKYGDNAKITEIQL